MRHDALHGRTCFTLALVAATVAACTSARTPATPATSATPAPGTPAAGAAAARAAARASAGQPDSVRERIYFEFQVEQPAIELPGSARPRYPAELRASSLEGEVEAQYVVDTTGRVIRGSFKVLRSTHDLFTAAVRDALDSMRFSPGRVGGRKVKQLVQQPFHFQLTRDP